MIPYSYKSICYHAFLLWIHCEFNCSLAYVSICTLIMPLMHAMYVCLPIKKTTFHTPLLSALSMYFIILYTCTMYYIKFVLALRCVQGAVIVTLSHHHLQMIHALNTKNDVAISYVDYKWILSVSLSCIKFNYPEFVSYYSSWKAKTSTNSIV